MTEKKCALCGATENLCLHHMDGHHGQFLPDAVIWLCRRCHAKVHAKRDNRFFRWEEVEKKFKELLRRNETKICL